MRTMLGGRGSAPRPDDTRAAAMRQVTNCRNAGFIGSVRAAVAQLAVGIPSGPRARAPAILAFNRDRYKTLARAAPGKRVPTAGGNGGRVVAPKLVGEYTPLGPMATGWYAGPPPPA